MTDGYMCDRMKKMVMSEEDWLKLHEGHEVVDEVQEFELDDGRAVKKMHHHKCLTCGHAHLFKYETVERSEENHEAE